MENLSRHKHIHLEYRAQSFPCDICDKTFAFKNSLKRHMKLHETIRKVFKCSVCDKEFIRKDGFNEHMKIHLSDKMNPCDICGRKFSYKHDQGDPFTRSFKAEVQL